MKRITEAFRVACVVLVCGYGLSLVTLHIAQNLHKAYTHITASL